MLKYPANISLYKDQTAVEANNKPIEKKKIQFEKRVYTDCINDGQDPSTTPITPPFKMGVVIDQTYMIDNNQQVFLIYPVEYNEQEYAQVIDCIKVSLGGPRFFKKNGVKVVM